MSVIGRMEVSGAWCQPAWVHARERQSQGVKGTEELEIGPAPLYVISRWNRNLSQLLYRTIVSIEPLPIWERIIVCFSLAPD